MPVGPMNRRHSALNGAILWATTQHLALGYWRGIRCVWLRPMLGSVNQVQQSGGVNVPNNPPSVSAQTRDIAGAAKGLWSFLFVLYWVGRVTD